MVTSSRIPLPLRRLGTSVSVIEAMEIEARGNPALFAALRQLPSIQTSGNGGIGQPTSLRIRGEEGFRTLALLDGIRLLDPGATQLTPLFEHLLASGVHRVEILRGPQGLSYGADAGGVVNISTRSGVEGLQGRFDAQAGDYGTRQLSGNLGGGNGAADFFVSAARFETDGFNIRRSDDVVMDEDGYENTTLHARAGIDLNAAWRLDLVHRYVDGEAMYDGCFSPTLHGHDCLAVFDQKSSRAALEYDAGDFSHSLSWSTTGTDRDNLSSGASAFAAHGELERWEYLGSATGLPGFDLVFGADLEQAVNGDIGRDNAGLYLEYLSDSSDHLFLTAGVRHDDNDDFGANTSYRVSGAYLFHLDSAAVVKLRGSLGTGFRAPSPYEIAYNSGPFAAPPATEIVLRQETSEGWEIGVEYLSGNNLRLEAVYFDQEVTDAIEFDLASFSGYLQDDGVSTSKGVELAGEWFLDKAWRLSANYTWNDTERPNGLQRLRRPQTLFNVGVSWYGMDTRLNLNGFLRAARNAIDEAGGAVVPLDDFEVLDLTASYRITDTVQVYGRLENALDEDYMEVDGYFTPDRAAYLGFRMQFLGI